VGYIVATHIFAVGLFDLFSSLSGAGQMAAETFGELKQAWEAAAPGAAKDAAWAALDQHAQSIANLWGIKNLATVVLALPVGIVALVVVSLLTPRQEPVQPRPH
jgi:cation/acetate symporter